MFHNLTVPENGKGTGKQAGRLGFVLGRSRADIYHGYIFVQTLPMLQDFLLLGYDVVVFKPEACNVA